MAQNVTIDVVVTRPTCKKCGHEFASYKIILVGDEQILYDQDGDLVFELEKTCHFCDTVFPWHSKFQKMQDLSKTFRKLMASLNAMHEHQLILENEK